MGRAPDPGTEGSPPNLRLITQQRPAGRSNLGLSYEESMDTRKAPGSRSGNREGGNRSSRTSVIAQARADAVNQQLVWFLTDGGYDPSAGLPFSILYEELVGPRGAKSPWTRREIQTAIADLVDTGRIRVEAADGEIVLHPVPALRPRPKPVPPPRQPGRACGE